MMADSSREVEILVLEYVLTLPSPPDRITRIEATIEEQFARGAAHLADARRMFEHLNTKWVA